MNNFNGLPKFEQFGGVTPEKAAEIEKILSIEESEKMKFAKFMQAVNSRMDALAKEGVCPAEWIRSKREAAQTITNVNLDSETIAEREKGDALKSFFSKTSPEEYGAEFAEIGLDSILQFVIKADSLRDQTLANITPVVDQADEILMHQDREDISLAQKEKLERIKGIVLKLKEAIRDFNQKIEDIKNLKFTLEDKSFDSLKNEINDLRSILNIEKKDIDPSMN